MNRTFAGWLLSAFGAVLLFYYWMVFDIGVPAPRGYGWEPGEKIVNVGLVQDRQIGTFVAIALSGFGLVLALVKNDDPNSTGSQRPNIPQLPPPVAPPHFRYDLQAALSYSAPAVSLPSVSRVIWERELGRYTSPSVFTPKQLAWGHLNDVPPQNFSECIAFIESYRLHFKKRLAGLTP